MDKPEVTRLLTWLKEDVQSIEDNWYTDNESDREITIKNFDRVYDNLERLKKELHIEY